ncbi:GAF and ANTAR domain-containing protein [Paenarthrobacter sp. MSM-2-10-13]|uniref:GAF and ANTAR domain-containing protein n=1 Tax=Micrococcaceae TaxID=1268 RepID=UPI00115EB866|nr:MULTISPECIES: GAF and ANTAR domain-containing protein [Micrococcaceae]NHW46572.1 GAF and ANTAR domain-containing protein [Paenarthrobacter sp. MSM-2-10-13]TQS94132.1 ANTAR domain-containing protein [Arthrobacter sp. TS-15]BCW61387.1 RNA-binding protein [Arthrobacter sp. StoSoilB22]
MEPTANAEHIRSLHELVVGSSDIHGILNAVTGFARDAMSKVAGENIDCALTLRRRKRTATVAGSSERAVQLDKIEQELQQGPCLEALDAGHPVLLADVATDTKWPLYSRALAAEGVRSALGVPMDLGETSQAVINFFAPTAGIFTDAVIAEATAFADVVGSTLRLAIRIEAVEQLNADLKTAMSSRTVIDLACGVIMAQNRCNQDEAFSVLTKASSHRNQKLHAVASEIIANLSGSTDNQLRFDD